ncbi:MAG: UDP-N-acetylmuramate dehydrogenase [Marinobacter sp.]|nr:UDP-N-acetylmuramate dehydrogenase [Marinobacter sp.]MDX1633044.1 UDP-N-acetylmuramate dehydrogenase [Marinobacter sp.]
MRGDVQLQELTTLKVPGRARYFVRVTSLAELQGARAWAREKGVDTLLVGGGSNLVLQGDVDGLVIHMAIAGRSWDQVTQDSAVLVLGAGENWHSAVLYAAASGYRGIENLALIPGTTGAAPVQNIGAYGVELKDTLVTVTALDWQTGERVILANADCRFAYRDSLFKQMPGRYVIVEVRLRLSRKKPLALGYGDLVSYFSNHPHPNTLTPLEVAEAVMAVRRRKLPDPEQMPNVGSFFKNPVVPETKWRSLVEAYPDIVAYPADGEVKLAAGWLIDRCGWKGYRNRTVGVHNRQALVLINHSGGTGDDVLALAARIREDVLTTFGVELEMEPRVVGG